MTDPAKEKLVAVEKRHCWHPFTQMAEWCDPAHDPLIITGGSGVWLRDIDGLAYIDGNSSIWTNVHGHSHPRINQAVASQLDAVAHTSFLGATHAGAIELAARLVDLWAPGDLSRVFYSDDGSTAIEVALKMAVQYWQLKGEDGRREFAAFSMGYHGDTSGAASLCGIPRFHDRFSAVQFAARRFSNVEELEGVSDEDARRLAAIVIEPLVQGVAGVRLWPAGMLAALRAWCDRTGVLLIVDEVMTGFGRTGRMFACQHEAVVPDLVALAKGLTGGYLPLAATLVSEQIYKEFLGVAGDGRAFLYGHSYTGNALGCAAALASLDIFEDDKVIERLAPKIELMRTLLGTLDADSPHVLEVRQCGFIAGIELCADKAARKRYPADARMGAAVCRAARKHGLLTRPIDDVVVLMPPLCIGENELLQAVQAIALGIREVCG